MQLTNFAVALVGLTAVTEAATINRRVGSPFSRTLARRQFGGGFGGGGFGGGGFGNGGFRNGGGRFRGGFGDSTTSARSRPSEHTANAMARR